MINENENYIEKNFLLIFVLLFNPTILIIGITGLEYALVIFFMSLTFLYFLIITIIIICYLEPRCYLSLDLN